MPATRLVARAVLVSALTVTLVPVLGASPAFACSCAGYSEDSQAKRDKRYLEDADVVFKGTLLKVTPPKPRKGGVSYSADPATYEFEVGRVHKGIAYERTNVSSAQSGASCGIELSGPGPFLVFANRGQGGTLQANLCGGTRELGPKENVALGPGREPTRVVPKNEQPAPRSKSGIPSQVAVPLVGGLLTAVVASAAWATRPRSVGSRRP
ncbi:MAG: hypothetical protein ACT4QG_05965 [Sporichthyaceae bacterium]